MRPVAVMVARSHRLGCIPTGPLPTEPAASRQVSRCSQACRPLCGLPFMLDRARGGRARSAWAQCCRSSCFSVSWRWVRGGQAGLGRRTTSGPVLAAGRRVVPTWAGWLPATVSWRCATLVLHTARDRVAAVVDCCLKARRRGDRRAPGAVDRLGAEPGRMAVGGSGDFAEAVKVLEVSVA